jgi:hypothetical protein
MMTSYLRKLWQWALIGLLLAAMFGGCRAQATQAVPGDSGPAAPRVAPARPAPPSASPVADGVAATPAIMHGIGILGDSFYDEYQGTDNRGGAYHNMAFNSVELLVKLRGFNLGPWGDWGEPRRTGYSYDWARSGATSATMIEMGQHTGLAQQIRAGEVSFVLIGVGANDFNPYYLNGYQQIYNGELSDAQVQAKIDDIVNNIMLAVDTVKQAGAQGVAVTLVNQWNLDPVLASLFPDAARRQRVTDAIDTVNRGITQRAAGEAIVIDQITYMQSLIARLSPQGMLNIAGETLDFAHHGDEPHHILMEDNQHLGTVASGLVANYYFIKTLNEHFSTHIAPLSDEEILRAAGL